jgi:RNA polymerase sigma-54 factor
MTPGLRQSLRVLSMTVGGIRKLAMDIARDNPFLDAALPDLPPPSSANTSGDIDAIDFDRFSHDAVYPLSLSQHVLGQIDLIIAKPDDRILAYGLLEYLSSAGWLEQRAIPEMLARGVDHSDLMAVLSRLQTIEPVGLFARNLGECLGLQLLDRDEMTPMAEAVLAHLDLVPQGLERLAEAAKVSIGEAADVLVSLRRCNPKPGAMFLYDEGDLFCPDLIVTANGQGFDVVVNDDVLPKLEVREDLSADDEAARILLDKARAEVQILRRAIRHRHEQLLAAGAYLIDKQMAFLKSGERWIVPFTMTALADLMAVHKSTISRLVDGKLVHTPRGMMEMAMFFDSGVEQPDGRMIASRAITAYISAIIESEDRSHPVSDGGLALKLKDEGIIIARRTIAKYRQKVALPQHQRKKMI